MPSPLTLMRILLAVAALALPTESPAAETPKSVPYFRDPQHAITKPIVSWTSLKQEHVVMQKFDYSCGPACLATVIRYFWGDRATEEEFVAYTFRVLTPEQFQDRRQKGLSITDLRRAAVARGYEASLGRITLGELPGVRIPIIVRLRVADLEHFVVVRGVVDDRVFLADPIRGNIRVPIHKFAEQWPDRVLLVVVKPGTEPPKITPLTCLPGSPAQNEMEAARGALFRSR